MEPALKRIFIILALVLFAPLSRAAVSFGSVVYAGGTVHQYEGTQTSETVTNTGTVTSGQRVVINIANEANSKVVYSITGPNGETATFRGKVHTSSVHNAEMWDYVATSTTSAGVQTVAWSSSENTTRNYVIYTVNGTAASQPDVAVVATTATGFNTTINTTITSSTSGDFIAGIVAFQGDNGITLLNGTAVGSAVNALGGSVGVSIQPLYTIKTPAGSFGPGGTMNNAENVIVILTAYAPAVTHTYYVASSGSDSANGLTTGTPWAHGPGDTNATSVAASTTLVAGDTVVYKGGDTFSFDCAIKQAGASGLPITYDGSGTLFGTGRAIIDLNNTYYHAFYSNPGKGFITIKGFKILHAKNNNNAQNVMINRAESDQVVSYAGDGDIYSEGGIFDFGGTDWVLDGLDISEFENCYDRAVLNAENDTDMPFVTPQEIPCTKAGIELYNGAHNPIITNCNLWAIGRTGIKLFGVTNFLVTDCNIGGDDSLTNKGWFAVAAKPAGNGGWYASGTFRRVIAHDGWQYQGDEAQQRCHAGDWFHLFGDPSYDHAGLAVPSANDTVGILFDRVYCYSNHKFVYYNGTSYYFLESGCFNIEWRNCISLNAFSGDIEARDSSNLVVNAHLSICEGTQPFTLKAKSTKGFPIKKVTIRNSVFYTQSANSANVAIGSSGAGYDGEAPDTDYNIYFATAHNNYIELHGTNYHTLTAYRAQVPGMDVHSQIIDPGLMSIPTGSGWNTTTSGNFHPNSTVSSPLIGAGLDQSGVYTMDYEGNIRSTPWTIGPLPAQASVPPTPNSGRMQPLRRKR